MQISTSTLVPLNASWSTGRSLLPGLLLTSTIAGAAFVLRASLELTALSPLIIAIILGLAYQNVIGTAAVFKLGVAFSMRRILRLAIILLGLQLSLQQVAEVGGVGLAIITLTLGATFVFTVWLGRALRVDRKLTELIAAGTSICGASAVVATNTVTRAPDEDVAYAVACVTVFGSASMLLYPSLVGLLQLTPRAYGLWAGASIHEIAQVVAAAFQGGIDAGNFGTITKLSRVMLLAPVVLALGYFSADRLPREHAEAPAQKLPTPWFVLGFIALMLINSFDLIPHQEKTQLVQATTWLFMVALVAMGLQTDIRKLRAKGWKPFIVGAGAWLFISVFSLLLVEIAYT